jgi:hypothetical protein
MFRTGLGLQRQSQKYKRLNAFRGIRGEETWHICRGIPWNGVPTKHTPHLHNRHGVVQHLLQRNGGQRHFWSRRLILSQRKGHVFDEKEDRTLVFAVGLQESLLQDWVGDESDGKVHGHQRMARQEGIDQPSGRFGIVQVMSEPSDHPGQDDVRQVDLRHLERVVDEGFHPFDEGRQHDTEQPGDVPEVLPHRVPEVAVTDPS